MTELAVVEPTNPTSDGYRSTALARLGEWAESARAAHAVATSLCKTSFVPEAFRDKPEETTAAILAGAEVGLTPMAAIKSFDIIQGVAAPRALTLRAIAQSMGHQILIEESTATRCIVRARRRGEMEWQTVTWTMDRAKQLGLAGKPNWRTQPQTMLIARATAEGVRLIAADAILGIGYAAEEIGDGIETTAPPSKPKPASKTRRMSLPKPPPSEPDAGAEASTPSPPEASGLNGENASAGGEENAARQAKTAPASPITAPQRAKMHALFRGVGIEDRSERLRISTAIVNREVGSANELTSDEASALIDTLETVAASSDPIGELTAILAEITQQGVQETFDAEIVEK